MHPRADLLRLLHDPLSYYRPWQQAGRRLAPVQRSALNTWLSKRYALPAYREPPATQIVFTRRLLREWSRLPQVAYLLACAKHRRRLMGSSLFLSQPAPVHAFLRLPFAECELALPQRLDNDALHGWGAAYLLEGLHGRIPDWLQARARLCFAGLTLPPITLPRGPDDFDLTCFWSAWNHAANLS